MERVAAYYDGFNLYHAIDDLRRPHLKWVDLRKLARQLISTRSQRIVRVRYFSAYAKYFSNTPRYPKLLRHREYIKALKAKDVECHMGNFAKRHWNYYGRGYQARWRRREEKQTDVGIAAYVLHDAIEDVFDRALIVSVDTDMIPLFEVMASRFPGSPAVCVAPPNRPHHRTLQAIASSLMSIQVSQIERSLFTRYVRKGGAVVAKRPPQYRP